MSASSSDRRARVVRLRLVLGVIARRVAARWREVRTGKRRRWIEALPPPGQSGRFVLLRGATLPIRRERGGEEFAPDDAPPPPPVAWRRSEFWRPRGER